MPYHAFADSCIFIAYGTDFEDFHPHCVAFFEQMNCEKHTSESVKGELDRKLKRRNLLYIDYSKFLTGTGAGEYRVSPGIHMNANDLRHLKDLIRTLSSISAHEQLTFLRLFGKNLKLQISKAMGFITQIAPRNNDVYFKDIIRSVIVNDDDSWIVNDAVHWSLSIDNAIFVTSDGDIYNNREELLRKVIDFKSLTEAPMQIIHIRQLI